MLFNQLLSLEYWKNMLYLIPALVIGLSFHEFAHAYAAYRMGDPTARNLGRMTLNPFRHLDPIGSLMLLIAHFGWAKPVPVNSRNFRNYKQGEVLVSLAGIVMNLLLAFASAGLFYLLFVVIGWDNAVIANMMVYMIFINLNLMLFNLIPVYPLDGYHIFKLVLIRRIPNDFWYYYERYGTILLIALLFFGAIGSLLASINLTIANAMMMLFGAGSGFFG